MADSYSLAAVGLINKIDGNLIESMRRREASAGIVRTRYLLSGISIIGYRGVGSAQISQPTTSPYASTGGDSKRQRTLATKLS